MYRVIAYNLGVNHVNDYGYFNEAEALTLKDRLNSTYDVVEVIEWF